MAEVTTIEFVDYDACFLGKVVARSDVRNMTAEERAAEVREMREILGSHIVAREVETVPAVSASPDSLADKVKTLQDAIQDYYDTKTAIALGITAEQVKTINRLEANEKQDAELDARDSHFEVDIRAGYNPRVHTFWWSYEILSNGKIMDVRGGR